MNPRELTFSRIAIAFLCLLAAEACAGDAVTIRGTIIEIEPGEGKIVCYVHVRHERGKIALMITNKTKVERMVGKKTEPWTVNALVKGDQVQAEHTSIVIASDPASAGAYRLILLSSKE